jgi:hypothetical protein
MTEGGQVIGKARRGVSRCFNKFDIKSNFSSRFTVTYLIKLTGKEKPRFLSFAGLQKSILQFEILFTSGAVARLSDGFRF